jgi:hypothetical protein
MTDLPTSTPSSELPRQRFPPSGHSRDIRSSFAFTSQVWGKIEAVPKKSKNYAKTSQIKSPVAYGLSLSAADASNSVCRDVTGCK